MNPTQNLWFKFTTEDQNNSSPILVGSSAENHRQAENMIHEKNDQQIVIISISWLFSIFENKKCVWSYFGWLDNSQSTYGHAHVESKYILTVTLFRTSLQLPQSGVYFDSRELFQNCFLALFLPCVTFENFGWVLQWELSI